MRTEDRDSSTRRCLTSSPQPRTPNPDPPPTYTHVRICRVRYLREAAPQLWVRQEFVESLLFRLCSCRNALILSLLAHPSVAPRLAATLMRSFSAAVTRALAAAVHEEEGGEGGGRARGGAGSVAGGAWLAEEVCVVVRAWGLGF